MQQLTGLDAAFLAMESPVSTGHVGGVCLLDPSDAPEPLTLATLTELLAQRLPLVPVMPIKSTRSLGAAKKRDAAAPISRRGRSLWTRVTAGRAIPPSHPATTTARAPRFNASSMFARFLFGSRAVEKYK